MRMKLLSKIKSPHDLKNLSADKLPVLAGEIRRFLINNISKTGGHLASNLGVVELTLALHRSFDAPTDKIIWDVGHQAYVHKILTGRAGRFRSLRKLDGLSGFPKCEESEYDMFDTGHASTSISVALGMCAARDLKDEQHHVVAIIGDGSMTGGLAYEAINNAGRSNTNIIVVLNDNQMSISENVGALSRHLNDLRTNPTYIGAKANINSLLNRIPIVGKKISRYAGSTKTGLKYMLLPGIMFEELGFTYIGPIDGHDTQTLIDVFEKVKRFKGPILLHVNTTKGKGYHNAEAAPSNFHGVDSFHVRTGEPVSVKIWDTYSDVFGKTMCKLASQDKHIVAVTAAMPEGVGLSEFGRRFPDRLFDVGIAEGHAVTFASGLAKSGFVPVVCCYSTFLQRAYDQILHDCCIQKLHVVFAVDRAGAVGPDGETHQGNFDIAFLSHIPNMTILSPKNKQEFISMLEYAMAFDGPIAIRYPKGVASRAFKYVNEPICYGKAEVLVDAPDSGLNPDVLIIAAGAMAETAEVLYARLTEEGYGVGIINTRFIKPLDTVIFSYMKRYKTVCVMEDHGRVGGLMSALLNTATETGESEIDMSGIVHVAFPDRFIEHGSRDELFARYQMDADSVYQRIIGTLINKARETKPYEQ